MFQNETKPKRLDGNKGTSLATQARFCPSLTFITASAGAIALILFLTTLSAKPAAPAAQTSVVEAENLPTKVPRKKTTPAPPTATNQKAPSQRLGVPTNPLAKFKYLLQERHALEAKTVLDTLPETQETLFYKGVMAAYLNDQPTAKKFLTETLASGTDETIRTSAQKILTVYRDFELERDGRIEHLQTMLAQAMDQAGEYGLAVELAFDAIKARHEYRDAWIVLGHAFLNLKKPLDAKDALTKAIDLDAGHGVPHFFRALASQMLGQTGHVIADLEKALALGYRPAIQVKQELADAYFSLKNYEKAYPLYRDVVITDPTDIERFIRPIGLAINELGKPQETLQLAQLAQKSHPETAMARNLLGWADLANKNFISAHIHLNAALALDPNLEAAHLNLGQLAEQEGNLETALRYYETALEKAKKSGNNSIGNTATVRYNGVKSTLDERTARTQTELILSGAEKAPEMNRPAAEKVIPSLSLE